MSTLVYLFRSVISGLVASLLPTGLSNFFYITRSYLHTSLPLFPRQRGTRERPFHDKHAVRSMNRIFTG